VSRFQKCCDPTTPGEWLAATLIEDDASPQEKAAIYGNPNLPLDELFEALCDGEIPALYNPALSVLLLTNPRGQDDEGNDTTLRVAVITAASFRVAAAVEEAPRCGMATLRDWVAAAAMGANAWWNDPGFLLAHTGAVAMWENQDRVETDDLEASHIVHLVFRNFLGRDDLQAPFLFALAANLAALPGTSEAFREEMAHIHKAADLLSARCAVPADPRQLSLFGVEAA
jgi:hypothetical protein